MLRHGVRGVRENLWVLIKACVNGPRGREAHPALPVTAEDLATDVWRWPPLERMRCICMSRTPGERTPWTPSRWRRSERGAPRGAGDATRGDHRSVGSSRSCGPPCGRPLLDSPAGLRLGELARDRGGASGCRSRFRRLTGCSPLCTEDPRGLIQVLLHGEGSSCWPALRHTARHGLPTRIGLEDTLQLPEGSTAPDNAALVRAALQHQRAGPNQRLIVPGARSSEAARHSKGVRHRVDPRRRSALGYGPVWAHEGGSHADDRMDK
jgi:hypothetical protein